MNVLRVSNSGQRNAIEQFTLHQTYPDLIIFLKDGNGDWITSIETLSDAKYNAPGNSAVVIDKLTQFGTVIPYIAPNEIQLM